MSFHDHDPEALRHLTSGSKQSGSKPMSAPITAAQALEASKGAGKDLLPEIYGKIREAAAAGKGSLFLYKTLGAGAKMELEAAGFVVKEDYDQREQGYIVTIDWGPKSRSH